MGIQILIMVILVVLSAFFSATETAYSSLNRTRLRSLAENGNKKAKRALELAENYDDLLSTILIGNNIVNIGLASIATIFFVNLVGGAGATLSTVVTTVVVLVFGEISPKSMAKESPESFAMAVSGIIGGLIRLFMPINWLFGKWKLLLSKLFKVKDDRRLTQDELITMVEEVEQEGGMDADDSDLVRSAIEFHDQEVSDILTPRVRVEGVPQDASYAEVSEIFEESGYSRLPVYDETIDRIVGVIHQKDFYRKTKDEQLNLPEIMKSPVFVTENTKISDLMRLLQRTKSQLAVVVDEYGGTVGIVTMEDILEELVGEIWDEHDEIEVEFQEEKNGSWRIIGSAPVEELTERFSLGMGADASTVGGWVMELAERIPDVGEEFHCGSWDVQVLKADDRHVQEILLKPHVMEENGEE